MQGNASNDTLIGNAGNDYLDGDNGKDSLTGGDGKNCFQITLQSHASPGSEQDFDLITDFSGSQGVRL